MTIRGRRSAGGAAHAAGPDDTIVITPAQPFAVGRTTLVLEFANEYDRRAVGLYKMERADESYLFTQFEADDARKAFPCFDEPGFKIPWQLTIEVPTAYDAVSNTPERAPAERDGWKEIAFARDEAAAVVPGGAGRRQVRLRADRRHGRARPHRHACADRSTWRARRRA